MTSSNNSIGKKRKKPFGKSLLAGGMAGFVESSICHPLDTVKTRMQLRNNHIESVGTRLQHSLVEPAVMHVRHSLIEPALQFRHSINTSSLKRYDDQQGRRRFATLANSGHSSTPRNASVGPIKIARKIIRKEGFWSLYKGLSAVYVGIIPKMAIRFVSFEQYRDVIGRFTPLGDKSTNFTAGLLSGLTEAVLIVTPAEVCKIRMQSQHHSLLDPVEANARKYGNFVQTATTIVREEGYSALYKGLVPTMLRQGCNQAVNFTAYNAMKTYWLERERQHNESLETTRELPGAISMLIGGLSGAMGPIVNNPLDVVKTRLQKQRTKKNASNAPRYSGMIQACLKIAEEEGAGALWKGMTPRLMRIVPGQAITFTTYEAICRRL